MNDVCTDFYKRIEDFVQTQLDNYVPESLGEKVIHDTIWGSVVYRSWEMQLIDSPLFQRLRDIQQLGRAEMTYPAARHTRFEHSLGTTAIASRMIDKLKERSGGFQITEAHKNAVRLAALLHDVGHCFYSHLSENVYGNMPQFLEIRKEIEAQLEPGVHPKPHELFSYMIIKSKAMLTFFHTYIDYPDKGNLDACEKLLDACARMVVGQRNIVNNSKKIALTFLTDILNSDFDADKLDYTQRDSYTSGIALTYGIERFLMKIKLCRICSEDIEEYRMAITSDAVTTVEELIFNRNMLYVYMYRHQKVLAVEAAVRDIIQGLLHTQKIVHPCDFLKFTDQDIAGFSADTSVPFPKIAPKCTLGQLVTTVKNRALPKRVFELKSENVLVNFGQDLRTQAMADCITQIKSSTEQDSQKILRDFIQAFQTEYTDNFLLKKQIQALTDRLGFRDYNMNLQLRQLLYTRLCAAYSEYGKDIDFDVFDIHIVFTPVTDSKAEFLVVPKGADTPELHRFIYIKEWSDAFNLTNWRGYVYANIKIDRNIAQPVVKAFINEYN